MVKSKKAGSNKKVKSEEPVAVEDTQDNSNDVKTEDENEKTTQENGELDSNLKKKGKAKGANKEESVSETDVKDEDESEAQENEDEDDTDTKKPAAKKAKTAKKAESKPSSEPARKSSRTPATVTKESDEESYEVQELVEFRLNRGVPQFRVRWKGYTKSDDTWENEDSLNCPELLQKYKADHPDVDQKVKKRPAAKSPSTQEKKSKTEEDYEVEDIVGLRIVKGKKEFKVRWKGYKPSDDSWEPEKYLSCQDLIDKYLTDHPDETEAEEKKTDKKPKSKGKAAKGKKTRAK